MPITNINEWDLYRAALSGNAGIVNELITQKQNGKIQLDLDINFDDDGTTSPIRGANALYMAAKLGHVEIVNLLLKAGANPNVTCRKNKWTPLSIASYSSDSSFDEKKSILTLLLEHGGNPDIRDNEGATPIEHCENPELTALLKTYSKGGIVPLYQGRLIKNYNLLANALHSQGICNLTSANNDGICAGLSQLFIFYEKQNRSDEFKLFISFINSLTAESINNLLARYKKDKNLGISIAGDLGAVYSFSKLLYFMEGINRAQRSQFKTHFKSIQANWDKTQFLASTEANLYDTLKSSNVMDEGEFKFVCVGSHLIAIHRTPDAVYVYDPNHLKGPIIVEDEAHLELTLSPYLSPDGHIILSIYDISYGDLNRELDDIIAEYNDLIESDTIMKCLHEHYQLGKLSRTDFAYNLQAQLVDIINGSNDNKKEKYYELRDKINMYLSTIVENNIISPEFGSIDKKHGKTNLLQAACIDGKLELVNHLITNCGADINFHGNDANTSPLYIATVFGHVYLVKKLLEMGADPILKTTKGDTPLDIAKKKANTNETYAQIAELISSHLSMTNIIKESKVDENDLIAIKLAKCFKTYAHPPLLSMHWRSHRQLADTIGKTLSENQIWNAEQCKLFISDQLQANKVKLNSSGTFAEVIKCAQTMIDQHTHREEPRHESVHRAKQ